MDAFMGDLAVHAVDVVLRDAPAGPWHVRSSIQSLARRVRRRRAGRAERWPGRCGRVFPPRSNGAPFLLPGSDVDAAPRARRLVRRRTTCARRSSPSSTTPRSRPCSARRGSACSRCRRWSRKSSAGATGLRLVGRLEGHPPALLRHLGRAQDQASGRRRDLRGRAQAHLRVIATRPGLPCIERSRSVEPDSAVAFAEWLPRKWPALRPGVPRRR